MNSKKIKLFLAILCVLGFALNTSGVARSMTDDQTNQEIQQLNQQIKDNQDKMKQIEQQKAQYAANIAAAQAQADTLQGEMAILDNRIAAAELDLESTQSQIDQTNLEMKQLNIDLENKQAAIDKEKDDIATTLNLIYKEKDVSALEVLLMNDSLADFLNRVKNLEDVNKGMSDSLTSLKNDEADLEKNKAELAQKNADLQTLVVSLEQNKEALESDKQDKADVLAETQNSQAKYTGLVEQLKEQQDQANNEITNLEKTVREKLAALKNSNLQVNDNGMIWPVPKNYISTYFHDPDYPFRYLFEHPGVDIRAAQGTEVDAAESGYVAHAQMNGTAYAYIMIIHANGISTVYGHVSKIFVKADDYVTQGEAIGLSGGTPGTMGSGPFTTGPHLHFEVRADGVPVNPLEYLPQ
ncbi:MAG TPA: peptidoglycan DD-metalloendopeptidase family protein [Candidatus Nanoarchaeia archaeon]|nr:peptidoglycan DD-metalloendopeptidase family protein [Candidatus Nanoarchaeia archaeon]